jgi:hypothetical protein
VTQPSRLWRKSPPLLASVWQRLPPEAHRP